MKIEYSARANRLYFHVKHSFGVLANQYLYICAFRAISLNYTA